MKNTLSKIETSNKYRATKILNQASDKNKVRSALNKYAITQQATITDEQGAFKQYVNAYSISNIKLRGWNGLSYLKLQEDRLKKFLHENAGMEILIQVDFAIEAEADKGDDEGNYERKMIKFKSRRFEVLNTDDIVATLTKMADDIETQIGNAYL